jgi:LmbE family N-acetylglucosaminyl deacetylase
MMSSAARCAIAVLLAVGSACATDPPALPGLDAPITSAARLLVFAPHPDDETLGAAGLIRRVREAGGAVRVVLMTSGDAFAESRQESAPDAADHRRNAVVREHESIAAMKRLGVDEANVVRLGFPDMGLCFLASTYLTKAAAFESPYTNRERPPAAERVIPGAEYRGIDVRRELERVIAAFKPTLVAMPHARDEHPDHCATEIFAKRALELIEQQRQARPQVLHYLVHYADWPLSRDAGSGMDLEPPANFPAGGAWRSLPLSESEVDAKRQALAEYATQVRTMGGFLEGFLRRNELFVDDSAAAAPECWCDEKTVATTLPAASYKHRPAAKPRP